MADILEDIMAFIYASGGKKSAQLDDISCCPVCGAEIEEDDDGESHCSYCDE